MLAAAFEALQALFGCPCVLGVVPQRLAYLLLGALIGLALGAIPGLGGFVGLSLLLPFSLTMEPLTAITLAIGMLSTGNTSDTIPAVLFAVPGTNAAQATILDGHPMARRGEGSRALGAAYTASLMGGLFGAVVLGFTIPVLRPLVLMFGSPEFFMLALLGISMVATLSGTSPMRGLVAGAFGLLLGMFGSDPQTGVVRWSFGTLYLFDGLPLVPLALGMFALPEIVDLARRGKTIAEADGVQLAGGMLTGVRDAVRHWFLVLRSSVIGVWAGAMPGLGGTVVDWLAYGHAYQSEKGARDSFGTGDVRGVIAPESANNAKEGGSLVPTIAFGVPGSPPMVLLLAIFLVHGISPGTSMLTTNLATSYTLVWSLAVANVFGTVVCMLLGRYLVRIAVMPIGLVAPVVVATVVAASLQSSRHIGDLYVLLGAGVLGWLMKRLGWPRPPLILAFVLSRLIENYFFISTSRYGFAWLARPAVVVLGLLIVASVAFGVRSNRRSSRRAVDA